MIEVREIKDIDSLMAWRAEVIRNVFGEDAGPLLLEANRQYYSRHIQDGVHIAFVAAYRGEDCGCGKVLAGRVTLTSEALSGTAMRVSIGAMREGLSSVLSASGSSAESVMARHSFRY